PDEPAQEGDAEEPDDSRAVAPQGLASEVGDKFHDDAEGREDEDVDLRMAEEPEEVLPEIVAPTVGGEEERGLDGAVQRQLNQGGGQHRRRQQPEDRGGEDAP